MCENTGSTHLCLEYKYIANNILNFLAYKKSYENLTNGIKTLYPIFQMCVRHVSDQDNAGQHYKAVCRALVTEAKQLTSFLDNITRGQEVLYETKYQK